MEAFNTVASEPRYFEWLDAHLGGFVVNTRRPIVSANYLVLHRSSCRTIRRSRGAPGALTARSYQKVCADRRVELEEWARREVGGELVPCGICWPSNPPAKHGRGTQRAQQSPPFAERREPRSVRAPQLVGALPARWRPETRLLSIAGIRPLLASWDAATRPSQIRLKAYLEDLATRLRLEELPRSGLFFDLVVDVEVESRLSKHYDLENYLTPIALRLGHDRFVHVRALKRVGGGSSLAIGIAARDSDPLSDDWESLSLKAGSGSADKAWKLRLRAALSDMDVQELPPGPVKVDLAWRCSPTKNWVSLWKPTGDAMGPVLGEPDSRNPFNVADDRIVELSMHRASDPAVGRDVHVSLAWRGIN